MAVNRTELILALEAHGTVVFCDENNPNCYIVVVEGITTDMVTMKTITDNYLLTDYPYEEVMTLVDGVFKTEYDKVL